MEYFLLPLVIISGLLSLISGALMVLSSFLAFRSEINQSMNLDLEVIRVSKSEKKEESGDNQKRQEAWKEEIGAMEQLLTSLSSIKDTRSFFNRLLYGSPCISFEIANSSQSEEIIFYMAIPRKYRESIEKQIHSFFPNAVLEKAKDYNIFFPGSFTCASILKLKNKYSLPIKTYEKQEIDPLNAIANALSRLETVREGAALQVVLSPAGTHWRSKGIHIAHQMQQGKRLKDVEASTLHKAGRELTGAIHDAMGPAKKDSELMKDKKTVQLTPEEQELVKSIEAKSTKSGFKVNIRLVASAATQERAQMILAQMENAFTQYENGNINCFKIAKRMNKDIAYNFIFRNFKEEDSIILNTEEIASIFHLPISVTEAPKNSRAP